MNIYNTAKPYTYLIKCIPTGELYYGVRWRNKLPAIRDLWIKYFSSSKLIKKRRNQYGDDAFYVEVRREFDTVDAAYSWERKVLTRMKVLSNPLWLNQNIGSIKFKRIDPFLSEETKQKMRKPKSYIRTKEHSERITVSRRASGNNIPWNKGLTGTLVHTEEAKIIIGLASRGRKLTEEHKKQIGDSNRGKPKSTRGKPAHPLTEQAKQKISVARKGRKWYTNGINQVVAFECPGPDWRLGQLPGKTRGSKGTGVASKNNTSTKLEILSAGGKS